MMSASELNPGTLTHHPCSFHPEADSTEHTSSKLLIDSE